MAVNWKLTRREEMPRPVRRQQRKERAGREDEDRHHGSCVREVEGTRAAFTLSCVTDESGARGLARTGRTPACVTSRGRRRRVLSLAVCVCPWLDFKFYPHGWAPVWTHVAYR